MTTTEYGFGMAAVAVIGTALAGKLERLLAELGRIIDHGTVILSNIQIP